MSKDAALAFLQKVAESPELQQKLVSFAKEQGFEFSVEELTDAEMGDVAGGLLSRYVKLDSLTNKLDVSADSFSYKLNTTGF
jgi:hypothetical protein